VNLLNNGENMKNVIIALALMLSTSVVFAGDWYVGGGLGLTKYDFDGASKDQEGSTYFGNVGYVFDNNLGIEGEYSYTDTADLASGAKVDETNTYTLYGVGRLPLDHKDKVNLLVKGGVGYSDTTLKFDGAGKPSDNSWYPAVALGVEWMFTDSWGTMGTVDYKSYDFSTGGSDFKADPISYKVGLMYKF
jgi:hypothetical protein